MEATRVPMALQVPTVSTGPDLVGAAVAAFREQANHLQSTLALDRALALERSSPTAFRRTVAIACLARGV